MHLWRYYNFLGKNVPVVKSVTKFLTCDDFIALFAFYTQITIVYINNENNYGFVYGITYRNFWSHREYVSRFLLGHRFWAIARYAENSSKTTH